VRKEVGSNFVNDSSLVNVSFDNTKRGLTGTKTVSLKVFGDSSKLGGVFFFDLILGKSQGKFERIIWLFVDRNICVGHERYDNMKLLMNQNRYKLALSCLITGTVMIWIWVAVELGVMLVNWNQVKVEVAQMIVPEASSEEIIGKGVVVAAGVEADLKAIPQTVEIKGEDARPVIIRKYLEKYKSPLLPYADLIFELSQRYGFDYRWIVAIGQQESNLCKKIPENSHNCWGYGINSAGTLRFEDYETALKSYAEYLDREYFKKDRNTPELIMKKYCPHSNGSWAFGVNHFMEEMESGDFL
jgi:ribosomal protein L33